jgi:peptidoglycan hydrolase CwlO-like protein
MSKLSKSIGKMRLRINLPFITYEVTLDDLFSSKNIDERLARLGEVKKDLQGAIEAIDNLQSEALERKSEVGQLQQTIEKLQEDKTTAEALLQFPEESFARVLSRATAKSRTRGIIEGLTIGFVTGALSSLLIWYLTKGG